MQLLLIFLALQVPIVLIWWVSCFFPTYKLRSRCNGDNCKTFPAITTQSNEFNFGNGWNCNDSLWSLDG